MYQKTETVEKGYTKEQIDLIKKNFEELKKAAKSPSVIAYLKKQDANLNHKIFKR